MTKPRSVEDVPDFSQNLVGERGYVERGLGKGRPGFGIGEQIGEEEKPQDEKGEKEEADGAATRHRSHSGDPPQFLSTARWKLARSYL